MPKVINGYKVCPQCDNNKAVGEYGTNKRNKNGVSSWCLECCRTLDKIRTKNGRAIKRRKAVRAYRLMYTYGLTEQEFETMLASQQYKCRICKNSNPGGKGIWFVDHDHKLYKFVRGLLCSSCNTLLGMAKDNTEILANAIQYLDLQYVAY